MGAETGEEASPGKCRSTDHFGTDAISQTRLARQACPTRLSRGFGSRYDGASSPGEGHSEDPTSEAIPMTADNPRTERSSDATRRDFLKAAGAATVAATVGPTILHATDKAASKAPVLGPGD